MSSWNEPARVNERVSVAVRFSGFSVVTKKPEPEIDRSRFEVVDWVRPCWLTNWWVWALTPPAL